MVVRKRRRKNRLLGQRTRGHGDTKNRRGAGSRGGRGLAGSHKHKWSKYHGKFGKEKKKVLPSKQVKAINIDQLLQIMPKLVAAGKVSEEKGLFVVDGAKIGFDKLLSNGNLKEKLLVRNIKASKKAVEKIEKAGGRFEAASEEAETEKKEKPAEKAPMNERPVEEGKKELTKGESKKEKEVEGKKK